MIVLISILHVNTEQFSLMTQYKVQQCPKMIINEVYIV